MIIRLWFQLYGYQRLDSVVTQTPIKKDDIESGQNPPHKARQTAQPGYEEEMQYGCGN